MYTNSLLTSWDNVATFTGTHEHALNNKYQNVDECETDKNHQNDKIHFVRFWWWIWKSPVGGSKDGLKDVLLIAYCTQKWGKMLNICDRILKLGNF